MAVSHPAAGATPAPVAAPASAPAQAANNGTLEQEEEQQQ